MCFFFFLFSFHLIVSHHSQKERNHYEIVMFIWWHRMWNKDSPNQQQKFNTNASQQRQNHIDNSQQHNHHRHHHHDHLSYSVHHNCKSQSKCIRKSLNDHSSRMNSFCMIIILIHCFNVFVLAIGNENLTNPPPQPCDRTRRVFTELQGEISNGPPGYNYTQVSFIHNIFPSIRSSLLMWPYFDHIYIR